jgi:hypothetical protein
LVTESAFAAGFGGAACGAPDVALASKDREQARIEIQRIN